MNIITGNRNLGLYNLGRINTVFDMARHDHSPEKIEQERSWIQHLVDTNEPGDEIWVEAGVVFGYMEILEELPR